MIKYAIVILIVASAIGGVYFYSTKNSSPGISTTNRIENVSPTQTAKQPDTSDVAIDNDLTALEKDLNQLDFSDTFLDELNKL